MTEHHLVYDTESLKQAAELLRLKITSTTPEHEAKLIRDLIAALHEQAKELNTPHSPTSRGIPA